MLTVVDIVAKLWVPLTVFFIGDVTQFCEFCAPFFIRVAAELFIGLAPRWVDCTRSRRRCRFAFAGHFARLGVDAVEWIVSTYIVAVFTG